MKNAHCSISWIVPKSTRVISIQHVYNFVQRLQFDFSQIFMYDLNLYQPKCIRIMIRKIIIHSKLMFTEKK